MAYNANIPQPTDQLSQSQGDLLANFQAIKTLVDVNHEDFASADQGKHKFVTFTDQTANLPIAVAGNDIVMYNAQDSATETQLWIKADGGTFLIPFTQNTRAQAGWSYLPSGVKMAWTKQAVVNGLNTFDIRSAALGGVLFGPNWPGFQAGGCFNAQLTPFNNNNTYIMGTTISALTNLQIDFYVNGIGISGGQVYMSFIGQ